MPEKRIVMQVSVLWVTDDDDETVAAAMKYLDEHGPSPVDWVSNALQAGAIRVAFSLASTLQAKGGRGFDILVDGPDEWRASHDVPTGGPPHSPEGVV